MYNVLNASPPLLLDIAISILQVHRSHYVEGTLATFLCDFGGSRLKVKKWVFAMVYHQLQSSYLYFKLVVFN